MSSTLFILVILTIVAIAATIRTFSRRNNFQESDKDISEGWMNYDIDDQRWSSMSDHERRREYYRNHYLKSDAWKRKRYVVFKRDNWRCVYCGRRATQVHHKKYLWKNIGKEPIEWLVSVCKSCHEGIHKDRSE